MEQKILQIPPQYYEIRNVIDEYKQVICQKFRANQSFLIQQLQGKARKLKQSIAFYKKQTSSQNIQKLISKKKHEKQTQRLQLQIQWRNLTQKYKKLQQEQKKINQENRQNKFDLQNLQQKISQLHRQNLGMNAKIHKLKQQVQCGNFVTEIKNEYASPYKFKLLPEQPVSFKRKTNVRKSSNNFKLKLQPKKNVSNLDQQSKFQSFHKIEANRLKQPSTQQQNKQRLKRQNMNFKDLQIGNMYSYQNVDSEKQKKFPLAKGQKWEQLLHYLNKPQVRDKIFDLLRK